MKLRLIGDYVIQKEEKYVKYPNMVITMTVDGDNMVIVSILCFIIHIYIYSGTGSE